MEQPQYSQNNDPSMGQPMIMGGGMASPPIMATDPSLVKWLQEPRDLVNELRVRLKGYDYDEKARGFVPKYKPLLNEDGVNEIASLLRGHLNKIVQLSNFNEQDVNRMAKEATLACIISLYHNWARFGIHNDVVLDKMQKGVGEGIIKHMVLTYCENDMIYAVNDRKVLRTMKPKPDIAAFNQIVLLVDHLVFASLKKAQNGGERLFLTKTISESVNRIQTEGAPREKKKSFWSKLRL